MKDSLIYSSSPDVWVAPQAWINYFLNFPLYISVDCYMETLRDIHCFTDKCIWDDKPPPVFPRENEKNLGKRFQMLFQVDIDEHKILWMLRKNRKYRGQMLYTYHKVCFRLTRRLRSKRNFDYLCHIALMITISICCVFWTSNLSFCYLPKSVDFEIFLSHLIFILSWCLKCKIKLARKMLCFLKISFK